MITKSREYTHIGVCVEKSIYCPKLPLQKQWLIDGALTPNANTFAIIQRFVYIAHQAASTIDRNITFIKMLIVSTITYAKNIPNPAL